MIFIFKKTVHRVYCVKYIISHKLKCIIYNIFIRLSLFSFNRADSESLVGLSSSDDYLARVDEYGNVSWTYPININVDCHFKFWRFPYDKQICWIYFTIVDYLATEVKFQLPKNKRQTHKIESHEWTTEEFKLHITDPNIEEENHPGLAVLATMKRKSAYHSAVYVTPCVFIIMMTSLIFWIPSHVNDRLVIIALFFITTIILFLSLTQYLPVSIGSTPALALYYHFTLFFQFLILLINIILLNIKDRKFKTESVPTLARRIFLGKLKSVLCVRKFHYIPVDGSVTSGNTIGRSIINSDDLQFDNETLPRSPTLSLEKTLEDIRKYLRISAQLQSNPQASNNNENASSHKELVDNEWNQLTTVLERICFCFYIVFNVILSIALLSH